MVPQASESAAFRWASPWAAGCHGSPDCRTPAPAIGGTVVDGPAVGLADLRPFVAAQAALLVGDAAAARGSLRSRLPNMAAHLPAVLDVLRSLAEEPSLLKQTRVQARLLMGDWAAAADWPTRDWRLIPRTSPCVPPRLAPRSRCGISTLLNANSTCSRVRAGVPAVVVARAALAVERGDPVEKRDEALSPLLGRPASEWRVALPLVAASAPGTFGPQIEAAALAAAQKLAPQEPGLASTVAARALAGGAAVSQAAPLIKVQESEHGTDQGRGRPLGQGRRGRPRGGGIEPGNQVTPRRIRTGTRHGPRTTEAGGAALDAGTQPVHSSAKIRPALRTDADRGDHCALARKWPALVLALLGSVGKAFDGLLEALMRAALGAVRLTLEDPHRGACCQAEPRKMRWR